MNISLAIQHVYPNADPLHDYIVQDDGLQPVLRPGAEEKGRVRYKIKELERENSEVPVEYVEGVHYYYGVDYSLLTVGEDYDLVERGPYIAAWNLDVPQPTMEELEAAWEELQQLPEPEPPETIADKADRLENENKLLKAQISAQSERSDFIEDLIAELATQVYQ
ncbi:hypothetical protein C2I18_08970 [Paenibacillus sp. PK3_47]|uniref:XkdW family protein n=1 Tax=Paenibacillus sp. PK3_47 TaxID=2072642 RepID=UPI00201E0F8F|nr:XkdW family protein [Paenibacillus sp. PK3_47]UQZ33660.1 hypothetical protein C2I18_08970 [Paenibacillus sp. PK3_47]